MSVWSPCLKLVALAAAAASAAACVPEGPTATGGSIGKTIGGVPTYHTAWRSIEPHELMVNIVDLKGATVQRAEQRNRDNALVHQRAWLDSGLGWLTIEHVIVSRFNLQTTQYFNDPTTAKNYVAKFYKNGNRKFAYEESRKIHAYGERGGWVHLVRTPDTGRTCIFAMVAFLSDPAKLHSHITDEIYDTGVRFRYCSADRSLDEVVAFLKGLKIVPPGYNRSVAGS